MAHQASTFSARKTPSGTFEVFKDGKRVSTGSASALSRFGLSTSNLGTPPPPTTTSTPTPTLTPAPPTTPKPTLQERIREFSGGRGFAFLTSAQKEEFAQREREIAQEASAPTPAPTSTPTPVPLPAAATPPTTTTTPQAEIEEFNTVANDDQAQDVINIGKTLGGLVDVSDSAKIIKSLVTSFVEKQKEEAPASLVDQFQTKRSELGIEPLETELADIESKIEAINTQLLVDAEKEGERLVSVTQIGRRRGKLQQEAEQRIALLNVERSAVARRLDNKLNTLNTVMTLTQQDFANAKAQYDSEFTKSLQIISLIKGIENDEQAEAEANLNTIINLAQESGKGFADLTPDMQRNIRTLELEQGLPVGVTETFLEAKPNTKIISTTTGTDAQGNQIVSFIFEDPETGLPDVVKIVKTGGVTKAKETPEEKKSKESKEKKAEFDKAVAFVEANKESSFEELKLALQRDSDILTDGEINNILASGGIVKTEVVGSQFGEGQFNSFIDKVVEQIRADAKEEDTIFKSEGKIRKEKAEKLVSNLEVGAFQPKLGGSKVELTDEEKTQLIAKLKQEFSL